MVYTRGLCTENKKNIPGTDGIFSAGPVAERRGFLCGILPPHTPLHSLPSPLGPAAPYQPAPLRYEPQPLNTLGDLDWAWGGVGRVGEICSMSPLLGPGCRKDPPAASQPHPSPEKVNHGQDLGTSVQQCGAGRSGERPVVGCDRVGRASRQAWGWWESSR